MESSSGFRMFCTTENASTPAEQVPDNPLPDQVNPRGWDPEESDSDGLEPAGEEPEPDSGDEVLGKFEDLISTFSRRAAHS